MGNSKKIFVAVTNDVSTDQRVHKVCAYLVKKGFDIEVYGRVLPDTFEIERPYVIVRKRHWFQNNFLFYAEYNIRLLFYLLFRKYDYILSNDLDTLPACFIASKLSNIDLVYDSHEYYTETPELQGRKFVQEFWRFVEGLFLPRVKYSMTVSEPIAVIYNEKYGVDMKVLRNLPSLQRELIVEDVSFPTNNNVVLYQGVLNPGRGIKSMIKALKFVDGVDLVIIGYGKVKDELIAFVNKHKMESRVHFLGRIAYEKLPNYSKIADVGMVLEEPLGDSFKYSLPNKLFDFIHFGLPIIASPLVEVKKIVEEHKIGLVIENHQPKEIVEKLTRLLKDDELRTKIKFNQDKCKDILCWENDVKILDTFFK